MSDSQRLRERPSVRFAHNEQVIDLTAESEKLDAEASGRRGHREKALFRHGPMTVGLFHLEPGAHYPDHQLNGDVLIQVLDGQVRIKTDAANETLRSGQLMTISPGVRHDLTADERTRLLITFCLEEHKTGS